MKTAQETLEAFFLELKKKDVKYSDVVPFLTKTQQHDGQFIGRININGHINGLFSLANVVEKITVREKKGDNLVMDFVITFHGKVNVKYAARLVKEIDVRKPDEAGTWGINLNSFRLQKLPK